MGINQRLLLRYQYSSLSQAVIAAEKRISAKANANEKDFPVYTIPPHTISLSSAIIFQWKL